MWARACSACRAIHLPVKPRTLDTTSLLISVDAIRIRKRPFSIPLSNKQLTAVSSYSRFPVTIEPKQHYFYTKDPIESSWATSLSDSVNPNTRDIFSIMAILDMRQHLHKCQEDLMKFDRLVEDDPYSEIKVADEGKLHMDDGIGEQRQDGSDRKEESKPEAVGKIDDEDRSNQTGGESSNRSNFGSGLMSPAMLAK